MVHHWYTWCIGIFHGLVFCSQVYKNGKSLFLDFMDDLVRMATAGTARLVGTTVVPSPWSQDASFAPFAKEIYEGGRTPGLGSTYKKLLKMAIEIIFIALIVSFPIKHCDFP